MPPPCGGVWLPPCECAPGGGSSRLIGVSGAARERGRQRAVFCGSDWSVPGPLGATPGGCAVLGSRVGLSTGGEAGMCGSRQKRCGVDPDHCLQTFGGPQ